jgi:hypothetical protein
MLLARLAGNVVAADVVSLERDALSATFASPKARPRAINAVLTMLF